MAARVLFALVLILAGACRDRDEQRERAMRPVTNSTTFQLVDHVGWWHGRCLAIQNEQIASGTPVTLVVLGEPQVVRDARIGERVNSAEQCAPLMEGRAGANAKPGIAFYALESDSIATSDMGIGLFETTSAPTVVDGHVEANLLPDAHKNLFTSCASSEGIHFSVWADTVNVGKPLWTAYYFLDYDLTPTCP